jgi:phage terminase small subunit
MTGADRLTVRQQAFVDVYVVGGNATEAYKQAGYKVVSADGGRASASRLLTNANVRAAVEAGRQAAARQALVDATYVVGGLKREAELTGDGSSHSARVAALDKLARIIGLYDEPAEESKQRPPVTVVKVFVHE